MENLFDFRLLTSAVQNNDGNNSDYKFDVVKFDGHEHISELYHFNVLLAVHNVDDYQQLVNLLLKSRVVLTLHYKMNFDRNICGICENVAVIGESHERLYVNVRIVPAMSVLKHDARSRVFLNKSVPEIINQVFQEETRKYGPVLFKTQLLDMSGYPKEEIVTQFNESNWDFVNRLMEKVGIYYYFEQPQGPANSFAMYETMIMMDNLMFEQFLMEKDFSVNHENVDDIRCIHNFEMNFSRVCANVVGRGYDWDTTRTQKVKPKSQHEALFSDSSSDLFKDVANTVMEHFDSSFLSGNVDLYTNVAAQRNTALAETCTGVCANPTMASGRLFTVLPNRYIKEKNWFAVCLEHVGVQASYIVAGLGVDGEVGKSFYENHILAIPADVQYRTPLKTKVPKFYGVLPATVEGADGATMAYLDELGRYKIKLPYDDASRESGQSSCWVKLMTPYGGSDASTGFHFPLLKDAQVLIGFVEGNVDRPYIAGTIQDKSGSIVNSSNSYCNMIRTPAGNLMVLGDLPNDDYFYLIKNGYGYRVLGTPPNEILSKY
jgi:type VI secretion system VgrG family protein